MGFYIVTGKLCDGWDVAGFAPGLLRTLFGCCSDSPRECSGVRWENPNKVRTKSTVIPAQDRSDTHLHKKTLPIESEGLRYYKKFAIYLSASNNTSTGCWACLPVPSKTWCRQLVPGAAMITSSGCLRTVGNNTISPIFMDRS
ncbi:hypothetical protein SAMN05660816_00297 [Niastella yeongjuensis]|nr:hypothetical protein SAMN05660816_00297 [Niastella yeongjuensis]